MDKAATAAPRHGSSPPRILFAAVDVVLALLSLLAAYALRFNFAIPDHHLLLLPFVAAFVVAVEFAALYAFGCFRTVWRFFSAVDVPRFIGASAASGALFLVSRIFFCNLEIKFYPPISVALANGVLFVCALCGARWLARLVSASAGRTAPSARRVAIVGAGEVGGAIAYALRHENPRTRVVVGFLDDSPEVAGALIQGVPVAGPVSRAASILRELAADEVIVAPGTLARKAMKELLAAAGAAGARLLAAPGYSRVLDEYASGRRLRDADITDILRRGGVTEEALASHRKFLAGRRVLVTGAGGSIGSEIARQALKAGVASLTLVERGEFALFSIGRELAAASGADAVRRYVADVGDDGRMRRILAAERPEIVFHAAAYKHVPLMEENVCEAVRNNVLATVSLARACAEGGVGEFVLLSSDKAVDPSSVMGATKRLCERALLSMGGGTVFSAVRFGNVLGSTGSVVPIFRDQIERGGPVTVTHPDMTRYFMTIPEAVSLTLQAAAMGKSGSGRVFVLDMGEPVRIVELAEEMIRLAGKIPGEDIPIAFVGVRPGEKLAETLVGADEAIVPTDHPQIGGVAVERPPAGALDDALDRLRAAVGAGDDKSARDILFSFCARAAAARAGEATAKAN